MGERRRVPGRPLRDPDRADDDHHRALSPHAAQPIVDELRRAVDASRTTLRLDTPGKNFPAVAEALAPGVKPIAHDDSLDQRGAATAQWLMRTHEVLVQRDCAVDDPPAPPALLEVYQVRAQMLAPLIRAGEVAGWISVHEVRDVRAWTDDEVELLRAAARQVEALLDPEPRR